ncbi:MAG: Uma2 family endonuclease [Cyanobacteria bacterium J06642_2]
MTATRTRMSFQDYLTYDDGTDTRYELVKGQAIAMTPPTWQHIRIAKYLERLFDNEIERRNLPWVSLRDAGQRTSEAGARQPDVAVMLDEYVSLPADNVAVLERPALLIAEIVSTNWPDDYIEKYAEYEAIGVPEYWIVDYRALGPARFLGRPKKPTLFIHYLVDGEYDARAFSGSDRLLSPTFPELGISVEDVFSSKV